LRLCFTFVTLVLLRFMVNFGFGFVVYQFPTNLRGWAQVIWRYVMEQGLMLRNVMLCLS
jgi:hypothetical protein